MAYIGKTPITGNFVKLDAISVVNGQAGYTMNNGGSAFTDYENVNQFLVSLNGILQAPTDSFTVSGSTLTFASNLSTGDVIDFVIVLGNTLDIGTPSDATVTNAKTNFVSTSSNAGLEIKGDSTTAGTLQLNCEQNSHGVKLRSPAHSSGQSYTLTLPTGNVTADKFLKVASVSGSGTTGIGQLSFADAGGNNTPMFLAHSSSNQTIATVTTTRVVFDTEEFDDDNVFTNTSGNYKFTVPSAGKYWIYVSVSKNSFSGNAFEVFLKRTRSSVETMAMNCGAGGSGDNEEVAGNGKIFDCQVGDEFHVTAKHEDSGNREIYGGLNYTFFGAYKIIE